jgi:hypothetical protein
MKLLDILFEGRKSTYNSLDDVSNVILSYNSLNDFVNGGEYQNVRKFFIREFGDNWKEEYDKLTKKIRDNDENNKLESNKTYLKNIFKNNPEWNFDNISIDRQKVSGIYCSKHKVYKNNVMLGDLKNGHITPCNQCGIENRTKKSNERYDTNFLKGDESVKKYERLHSKTKYSDEELISISQEYKGQNINLFRQEKPSEYLAMLDKGPEFFNNIFSGFLFKPLPNDYLNAVKKYYKNKSFTEFRNKNRNVYNYSIKKGPFITDPNTGEEINTYEFLSEFTKDMIRTGNLSQRMVYAHEFYDGKKPVAVYVGLTYNEELRYNQHIKGEYDEKKQTTPVTRFIKENPKLTHKYKRLSDYVEEIEALKLEDEWERKYKIGGWIVLNVKRVFSLGGKSTKLVLGVDDLRDSINSFIKRGLDYYEIKLKYPAIINTIYTKKLQKPPYELLKDVEGYKRHRTISELIDELLEYDSVSELFNRNRYLYNTSYIRLGLKKLHKIYEDKIN